MVLNGQFQLGYTLQEKDTFLIKQTGNQEMVMEIEASKQIITNDTEALFLMEVNSFDGEVYTIDFEFKDFAIKSSSNIQGILMDVRASQPVEGDMMSTIFSGLLGPRLQIQLRTTGKILAVTGTDALIDKMMATVGELDEFTTNLMKKSLEKEFSSESLAQSFEQMTYFYGEAPVSIGDTWNSEFSGKINAKNEWKLEKADDTMVSISGTANITMKTNEAALNMDLQGNQETLIQASKVTGIVQKMMVSGSGKGISTMAQAKGVEIPTTLKQTITYELITE